MPFSVKAYHSDHPLTVTKETAKEAFAKAVESHVIIQQRLHIRRRQNLFD
jgi:hypothetical protein